MSYARPKITHFSVTDGPRGNGRKEISVTLNSTTRTFKPRVKKLSYSTFVKHVKNERVLIDRKRAKDFSEKKSPEYREGLAAGKDRIKSELKKTLSEGAVSRTLDYSKSHNQLLQDYIYHCQIKVMDYADLANEGSVTAIEIYGHALMAIGEVEQGFAKIVDAQRNGHPECLVSLGKFFQTFGYDDYAKDVYQLGYEFQCPLSLNLLGEIYWDEHADFVEINNDHLALIAIEDAWKALYRSVELFFDTETHTEVPFNYLNRHHFKSCYNLLELKRIIDKHYPKLRELIANESSSELLAKCCDIHHKLAINGDWYA